jgi:hypothetical protein
MLILISIVEMAENQKYLPHSFHPVRPLSLCVTKAKITSQSRLFGLKSYVTNMISMILYDYKDFAIGS